MLHDSVLCKYTIDIDSGADVSAPYRRQQHTGGFTAHVNWLGLRVGGRLALFYIHQMNRVNSRDNLVVMVTAL